MSGDIPFGRDFPEAPWIDRDGLPIDEPSVNGEHPDDPGPDEPTDDEYSNSEQPKAEPKPPRRWKVTLAKNIPPEPVTWAWTGDPEDSQEDSVDSSLKPWNVGNLPEESWGRIPAGTISIAAGPEGVGKSSFAIWFAAKVSNGTLPGAWYGKPRMVLYCAVEDSWKHTIVPRLIAGGANLDRVGRFDVVSDVDEVLSLSLPADNELLKKCIEANSVAAVVLDPLLSLIHENLDSHRERDVRVALDPLAKIADTTSAVIVGIAHWNKSSGADVTARITGSGAFKNVPRSVFAFARDPDTEDEFVMTQTKNSLGRHGLPSIRYRVESAPVTVDGQPQFYTGRFVPGGHSDKSVGDILASRSGDQDAGTDSLTPAQRFILRYVATHGDQDDEVPATEIFAAGNPAGYEEADLIKARFKIRKRIATRKVGMKGGWVWFLKDHPDNESLRNQDDK